MKRAALILAALAEALTGLALLTVPVVVGELLLGAALTGEAAIVARVAGVALVGLGFACWPGPPWMGMLIYSTGAALYLGYLGFTGLAVGPLLWPVVGLHGLLSLVLWVGRDDSRKLRT